MPAPRNALRFSLKKLYDWLDANVGGAVSVAWAAVTGKPATFAPIIGTTAETAMAGNDSRVTTAIKGAAIAGNVITFTRVDNTTFTITLPAA